MKALHRGIDDDKVVNYFACQMTLSMTLSMKMQAGFFPDYFAVIPMKTSNRKLPMDIHRKYSNRFKMT
jgi:hypothetical protein